MLYPSINLLRQKVDSRYTLVVLAAKRARDLVDGKPPLSYEYDDVKPVSIATDEIAEDLITYNRNVKRAEEIETSSGEDDKESCSLSDSDKEIDAKAETEIPEDSEEPKETASDSED